LSLEVSADTGNIVDTVGGQRLIVNISIFQVVPADVGIGPSLVTVGPKCDISMIFGLDLNVHSPPPFL